MNAEESAELPRPGLFQLAISTMVIAIAALGGCLNVIGGSLAPALINFGILVTQSRSTFFRSYRDARICRWLLVLMAVISVLVLMTEWDASERGDWNLRGSRQLWRSILLAMLYGVATVISFRWSRQLTPHQPPRLVRRFSLVELGVMVTSLCLVATLFAEMFGVGQTMTR